LSERQGRLGSARQKGTQLRLALSRIVYVLVGLSAIYVLIRSQRLVSAS
jgi:hypothetical protein